MIATLRRHGHLPVDHRLDSEPPERSEPPQHEEVTRYPYVG